MKEMELVKRVSQYGYCVEIFETYPGFIVTFEYKNTKGSEMFRSYGEARDFYILKCLEFYTQNK